MLDDGFLLAELSDGSWTDGDLSYHADMHNSFYNSIITRTDSGYESHTYVEYNPSFEGFSSTRYKEFLETIKEILNTDGKYTN